MAGVDVGHRKTHAVVNQPPPLVGYDVYSSDRALVEAVEREGGGWAHDQLSALGRRAGTEEAQRWARDANAHPPALVTHDRFGHRLDEVEFHPAWHALLDVAVGAGLHAAPWVRPRAGAHVARAAGFLVWTQVEAGHGCPVSMTFAAVPALRAEPAVAAEWEPRLTAEAYDPGLRPASAKQGALAGMAMTEKQGGSDVRTNTTRAQPSTDGYRLTGHKWFCSAPMADAFLVLAQAPGGLTCFLVPRVLADGSRNRFLLQRLKDKLGNRSNASAEVEFDDTWASRVGEEGRGVATIFAMVAHTRLDCVLGSAAGMRSAVAQATHHAAHRSAFGRRLVDQPLMANVLADLAVESEAATALAIRLAATFDRAGDESEALLRRVGTAVAKYWVCKRTAGHAAEALECLGGNGYVEDSGMPRLYREAPLNSIWEGAGNVNALDVLRAVRRQPATAEALVEEVAAARGADRRLDVAADGLADDLRGHVDDASARRLAERVALAWQGSLLVRHGDPAVADAFCASRLAGRGGHVYGTLPAGLDTARIVERARPRPDEVVGAPTDPRPPRPEGDRCPRPG